jgi:hypothetical protein
MLPSGSVALDIMWKDSKEMVWVFLKVNKICIFEVGWVGCRNWSATTEVPKLEKTERWAIEKFPQGQSQRAKNGNRSKKEVTLFAPFHHQEEKVLYLSQFITKCDNITVIFCQKGDGH